MPPRHLAQRLKTTKNVSVYGIATGCLNKVNIGCFLEKIRILKCFVKKIGQIEGIFSAKIQIVNLETGFDWFSNRVKVFIWVGIVFREVEKSSIIIMMYSAYLDVDGHKN